MALTESVRAISLPAAAGLTDSQYLFVNIDSNGRAALAGANGRVVGVLMSKPGQNAGSNNGSDESTDFAAQVGLLSSGRLKVTAGGTITAGMEIKSDAAGKAVDATTEVNNAYVCGIAVDGAAADEIFSFVPFVYRQAA